MDVEAMASIGMPIRPGPPKLLRGRAALERAATVLKQSGIEPEMGAAWVSALATDFPSLYRASRWPEFEVRDRDRFVKLRRIVREHLAKMF